MLVLALKLRGPSSIQEPRAGTARWNSTCGSEGMNPTVAIQSLVWLQLKKCCCWSWCHPALSHKGQKSGECFETMQFLVAVHNVSLHLNIWINRHGNIEAARPANAWKVLVCPKLHPTRPFQNSYVYVEQCAGGKNVVLRCDSILKFRLFRLD